MAQDFSHLSAAVSQYPWGTGSRTPTNSKIQGHSINPFHNVAEHSQILHASSQMLSTISRSLITPDAK